MFKSNTTNEERRRREEEEFLNFTRKSSRKFDIIVLFRVFFLNPNTYFEREREEKFSTWTLIRVISKRFLLFVVLVVQIVLPFVLFGSVEQREPQKTGRRSLLYFELCLFLARARKNANSIDDARINSPRNDSHALKYIFIRTKAWRKRRTSSQRGPSRCV